jgi:hypothetical protein
MRGLRVLFTEYFTAQGDYSVYSRVPMYATALNERKDFQGCSLYGLKIKAEMEQST